MHPCLRTLLVASLLPCVSGFAFADVTNFETQAAGAPSSFTSSLNSPLVIGTMTFGGGHC